MNDFFSEKGQEKNLKNLIDIFGDDYELIEDPFGRQMDEIREILTYGAIGSANLSNANIITANTRFYSNKGNIKALINFNTPDKLNISEYGYNLHKRLKKIPLLHNKKGKLEGIYIYENTIATIIDLYKT